MLPAIVDGVLYRAEVGHFPIGWRVFSDWSMKFTNLRDEKDMATFAIGMSRGALLKTTVK